MIRVVAEEIINGRTAAFAAGVPAEVRGMARLYLARYPDLLPEECSYLVIACSRLPLEGEVLFGLDAVEDHREEWMLTVDPSWNVFSGSECESRFVIEMLVRAFCRDGVFIQDRRTPGGYALAFPGGPILRGDSRDQFIVAVAQEIQSNRAAYGGGRPPCRLS
jgi:hypothetical protein